MNANGERSAYPWIRPVTRQHSQETGLTKRELFAAMAMGGLLGCSKVLERVDDIAEERGILPSAILAHRAIDSADALIAELEK